VVHNVTDFNLTMIINTNTNNTCPTWALTETDINFFKYKIQYTKKFITNYLLKKLL